MFVTLRTGAVNVSVKLINVYVRVNASVNKMFHVCIKFTHSVHADVFFCPVCILE